MPQRDVWGRALEVQVVAELRPTQLVDDHVQWLPWFAKSAKSLKDDLRGCERV